MKAAIYCRVSTEDQEREHRTVHFIICIWAVPAVLHVEGKAPDVVAVESVTA